MKSNRITITLSDTNKDILNESANKFQLSKSDILNYLLRYAHYPKYSAGVTSNIHQYNIAFEKINNSLNHINLDYTEVCNLINQIAKALNILVNDRSDTNKVNIDEEISKQTINNFQHYKFLMSKTYKLSKLLRKEVESYDSKYHRIR